MGSKKCLCEIGIRAIDGGRWIDQVYAGNAGEGEEVGFVGMGAGTDKTGEAGGDALLVDGGVLLVLNDGYRSGDRFAGGKFDETDEDQVSSSRECRLVQEEPARRTSAWHSSALSALLAFCRFSHDHDTLLRNVCPQIQASLSALHPRNTSVPLSLTSAPTVEIPTQGSGKMVR